jgi:isopentenyl-diphosphate delta-isomerase
LFVAVSIPVSPASSHDPTAESRKHDHIELAFRSQVLRGDPRFDYEPLLAAHPAAGSLPPVEFLGKLLKAPLWVSSMTGGTAAARTINQHLARACGEFGLGMGLGSCRQLLYSNEHFSDFDVRPLIGPHQPLYANLGVAQVEQLLREGRHHDITRLLERLDADGLIVHVNPLQEWLQPEGDRFEQAPLHTVERLLEVLQYPVIVKEVGQGMGPRSLRALLQLPLAALDFAANGGTNFAKLELLRSDELLARAYEPVAAIGHSAVEMTRMLNEAVASLGNQVRCQQVIISGGVGDFLDGYYLTRQCALPAVYGQASGFLRYARGAYDELRQYVELQIRGLELAHAYLVPRPMVRYSQ